MRSRNRQNGPATVAGNGKVGERHAFAAAGPVAPGEDDDAEAAGTATRVVPATARARKTRGGLKNLRVRSRLLLLITVPTAAALILGGASIASSVRSALAYQRVQQRAVLASTIAVLAQRLEDERDQTVYYIALPTSGRATSLGMTGNAANRSSAAEQLQVVVNQQQATNQAVAQFKAQLAQVYSSYTPAAKQEAANVQADGVALASLRHAATATQMPALVVVQKYTKGISDLLALASVTAQGASDPALGQFVQVLGQVSLMKEEASEQRAILTAGLIQQSLSPAELAALNSAQSLQQSNQQSFTLTATAEQRQLFNNSVSRSFVYLASSEESQAISLQSAAPHSGTALANDPTTADDWYGAMTNEINYQLGGVEHNLLGAVTSRAATLHRTAVITTIIVGGAVLLFLALALVITAVIARSMVRPLRRLRAGALEVAGVKLPETVRRMSESDSEAAPLDVEPIDVDSLDEIGEVARAFDQVHREAIRLASNEAALRGNVNAMFVNLSRRSQSLVERQIRLIDDLEQGEQDAERLSSMFQLDHLATRMRRNSENLLVLAGHEVSRRWTQSVALVDVLRAAVSEIEQYERVSLNVQPGISVRGQAVNDVVHLVAELAENATSFSAADTPVNISGHLLTSGGVLLDITDQGVGMAAEEMAHANWRLDNPPVVDVAVSRRMGLFVVARLAARHGIRVRLRPAATGGLTALVWLPDEVVTQEGSTVPPGLRRLEMPTAGAGPAGAVPGPRGSGYDAGTPADGRVAAERAVNAALAPRFTPLRADGADTASFPVPALTDFDFRRGAAAAGAGTGTGTEPPPLPQREPRNSANTASPPSPPAPPARTGPMPIYGAPVASDTDSRLLPGSAGNGFGDTGGQARQGVIVPPAGAAGEESRLPIFESLESDWFRRGRKGADRPAGVEAATAPAASPVPSAGWTSPADAGWQAAQAAAAPAAGGVTKSGLPKRVPRANLVPGTVSGEAPPPPAPVRSASVTRDRFASFQRGVREARAAAREADTSGDEENSGA